MLTFKNAKSRTSATATAIFLIISMFASTTLFPSVSAHTPPKTWPTYAYINVAPNPVGVGQSVTVGFWLNQPPPTANGPYGDRWENLIVTVTKPNGVNETLGPFTSDNTGGTWTPFVPTQVGNYSFQLRFPGQVLANKNPSPSPSARIIQFVNDTYSASVSRVETLMVQQDPIPGVSLPPLPTNYWTRPINAQNPNWYTISGNWLGLGTSQFSNTGMYNASGNYNPYTTAPTTAHILWTKPVAFGGIVGGEFGGPAVQGTTTSNFYSTSQYEPKFNPVIMNGVLFYELYPGSNQYPAGITALNLRTGQTIWTMTDLPFFIPESLPTARDQGNITTTGVIPYTTTLRAGQILDYVSPNQYGGHAYLWLQKPAQQSMPGISPRYANIPSLRFTPPKLGYYKFDPWAPANFTLGLYDAMSGKAILDIVNATALTLMEDDAGNLIGYFVNWTDPDATTLVAWNSTQALLYPNGKTPAFENWYLRPAQGSVIDFQAGVMWTVRLPNNISGAALPGWFIGPGGSPSVNWALSVVQSGVLVAVTQSGEGTQFYNPGWQVEAGFDALTGRQLWLVNRTELPATRIIMGSPLAGNGKYIEVSQDAMTVNAFSLFTGESAWTLQLTDFNPYDSLGVNYVVANGTLYLWGLGGDVWSIDIAKGTINWHFTTGTAGYETPYGTWPLWTFNIGTVAGGMLFVGEGHQYSPPLFRGAQLLAIDITNGQLVWSVDSFAVTTGPAVVDGVMLVHNSYDNLVYAYGQGPTATTVSAPQVGVTTDTPVTITGRVIDISPASKQEAVAANFPNGLPAVSDASQTQFMEAAFMQQPMPNNITGVPVILSVIDSNNNFRQIGTTTTNARGTYGFTWKPDIPGNYTVIATFAGSGAYFGSSDQTYFYASIPAQEVPPPETQPDNTGTIVMSAAAAIIVAMIIIGAVTVLVLRRRP